MDTPSSGSIPQLLCILVLAHRSKVCCGSRHLQEPLRCSNGVLRGSSSNVLDIFLRCQILKPDFTQLCIAADGTKAIARLLGAEIMYTSIILRVKLHLEEREVRVFRQDLVCELDLQTSHA